MDTKCPHCGKYSNEITVTKCDPIYVGGESNSFSNAAWGWMPVMRYSSRAWTLLYNVAEGTKPLRWWPLGRPFPAGWSVNFCSSDVGASRQIESTPLVIDKDTLKVVVR